MIRPPRAAALREALGETRGLCREHDVNPAAFRTAQVFTRVGMPDDAVEELDLTNSVEPILDHDMTRVKKLLW